MLFALSLTPSPLKLQLPGARPSLRGHCSPGADHGSSTCQVVLTSGFGVTSPMAVPPALWGGRGFLLL